MAVVRVVGVDAGGRGGDGSFPGEEGAEEEVLHDGELAEDLREVHLDEARVDFVPGLDLFARALQVRSALSAKRRV